MNKVTINFDTFGFLMKDWIGCNLQCDLIITNEFHGTSLVKL